MTCGGEGEGRRDMAVKEHLRCIPYLYQFPTTSVNIVLFKHMLRINKFVKEATESTFH